MRRAAIVASILLVLAAGVPADAGGTRGRVLMAVAHPTVPHAAYEMNHRSNGLTGWVFQVEDGDDATYTLTVTDGWTGFETMDVYFYEDSRGGRGPGAPCAIRVMDEGLKTETGVICPGPQVAAWGIAVLVTGSDARFGLTY